MKESFLQKKLIEKIVNKSFLDSIENTECLDEALRIDSDPLTIPDFSIDQLLKRKYSKSAKNVLKTLTCYDIISGDIIKNISLDKKDKLFPDCLLFNYETNEIIIIENKISKKTEREAITELLGYGQEIRNSLPFISDFDISYIIISTEFNTLLDHSISAQILSTESKILCLKASENNGQVDFDIHIPNSWTNIGQNNLPTSSFMSYTLTLKKRDNLDVSFTNIIQLAIDLINFDANLNKCSGFCIVWENGMIDHFDFGITIYTINPFVFLPNAIDVGFNINENSVLSNYIFKMVEESGIEQTSNSLFRIAERAKKLLDKYFIARWERNTSWEQDLNDEYYKLQRFPVFVESFGVIGDFIRYYYHHPAVRNHFFSEKELFNSSPNAPYIALQIINIITGNYIFKKGHFLPKDMFEFGRQLYLYGYSCKNAIQTSDEKIISNEAFLFWTTLPLLKSIKEIKLRTIDAVGINTEEIPILKIYSRKKSVKSEYEKNLKEYADWFVDEFLQKNSIHSNLFKIGFHYSHYFSSFFKELLNDNDIKMIFDEVQKFSIFTLSSIIKSFKNDGLFISDNDKNIFNYLIDCNIDSDSLDHILERIRVNNYEHSFSNEVLELVNSIYGEVFHEIKYLDISDSFDFSFLKTTADERFNEGHKYSAIIVSSNGEIGLGEINKEFRIMGELTNEDEIYLIVHPSSVTPMILKKSWDDIFNGRFGLINDNKK